MNFRNISKLGRRGASLIEYGMLVGLVAVVAIGAVSATGKEISSAFSNSAESLSSNIAQSAGQDEAGETASPWNEFAGDAITGVEFAPGEQAGWYGFYEPGPYGNALTKTGSPEIVGVNHDAGSSILNVNFNIGQSTFPAGFRDNKYVTCRTEENPDVFTRSLASADGEYQDAGHPYLQWTGVSIPELDASNTGGNTAPVVCEVRPS